MTCDEFREWVKTDPAKATDAEVSAVWSHKKGCPKCLAWIEARILAVLKKLPPDARDAAVVIGMSYSQKRIERMAADPETFIGQECRAPGNDGRPLPK